MGATQSDAPDASLVSLIESVGGGRRWRIAKSVAGCVNRGRRGREVLGGDDERCCASAIDWKQEIADE